MAPGQIVIAALAAPPLEPGGDEARQLLRRELAKPDYHDTDLLQRILDWVQRFLDDSVANAQGAPALVRVVAILVGVALVAAVVVLASRARRTARTSESFEAALTGEQVTAAELRERAQRALAAGDFAGAVVDAFRATAVHQIERDRIDDLPQATARELADALARVFPGHRPRLGEAAAVFDAVLYGDRPADREQASAMLALDAELAGTRVASR